MVFRIRTYNNIAEAGLEAFPRSQYEVGASIEQPDGILVRSANLHQEPLPETVQAIARAGAGVNNIPVEKLSEQGIPVFNAPGANANAVKELVLAGLFMGFRHIAPALAFVAELSGEGETFEKAVEAGKKRFVGRELPGRRLGVVGLGAIGGQVANAARALGMEVVGYDPGITVEHAWRLASDIRQARSLDELLAECDVVSLHVPLIEATRELINERRIAVMPDSALLLNFARDGLVRRSAVLAALAEGRLGAYVTDFPHPELQGQPGVVALPHLGASTGEAEANSAVLAVQNLREFLEHGNIRNSVNFPDVVMPRTDGGRLAVANANVPNMVGQVGTTLAEAGLNIVDLLNRSRGELAYTLIDVDGEVAPDIAGRILAIDGVLKVRSIPPVSGRG
ncbi:phosphoglycerate dehydrogenase [Natronospira bacteriovora]|uniref:D-3-phosphoglycerate dehydrogenase n=1 Tax=Natronospira bacteriovora TaxID=3069753 RepID=A0ABU0W853_9GAMM|nr:phosphoglycerate dehydrogenase [Natronospira sp. AB-CW4]MDQ2069180.1 phosphoglycerate dehydrogenase [Natronospira sp. AB-CW4]